MARKLTTAEWIEKAKSVHGDRYDYTEVDYKSAKCSVRVRCREHGFWDCQPSNHITHGRGCPVCGGSKKKTTEQFITDSLNVHGEKYDYSKALYINSHTSLTITCDTHGDFLQSPSAHLGGQGCPDCGREDYLESLKLQSLDEVKNRILKASDGMVEILGSTFSNINSTAAFVCSKHGRFERLVNSALYSDRPCLKCWRESEEYLSAIRTPIYTQSTAEMMVANLVDSDVSYDPFVYIGSKETKISLHCSKHGAWTKTFQSLLRMKGKCPQCATVEAQSKRIKSIHNINLSKLQQRFEAYLAKFYEAHGGKYDYSHANFENGKTAIDVICPEHGLFTQTPDAHVKSGCRLCADTELAGLYSERFFKLKPELKEVEALVYCLEFSWDNAHCFKFGITRTSLKRRFGMALAKGIEVRVLGICRTNLYDAWKYEVKLLKASTEFPYYIENKSFARDARISPTELFSKLPDNWAKLIPWNSFECYVLN